MDEARFGLKVWYRRRWCPSGHRPPWVHQDKYEWLWLYAAIEPTTGESFFLFMPHLDGDCFTVFLEQFRRGYPQDSLALVLDRSGAHTSGQVRWPAGIEAVLLPARSPELNPVERFFEELRATLSNVVFESLEALENALVEALRAWWEDPPRLKRLTGYGWWIESISNIRTSSP